jgi:hypothetical protein
MMGLVSGKGYRHACVVVLDEEKTWEKRRDILVLQPLSPFTPTASTAPAKRPPRRQQREALPPRRVVERNLSRILKRFCPRNGLIKFL